MSAMRYQPQTLQVFNTAAPYQDDKIIKIVGMWGLGIVRIEYNGYYQQCSKNRMRACNITYCTLYTVYPNSWYPCGNQGLLLSSSHLEHIHGHSLSHTITQSHWTHSGYGQYIKSFKLHRQVQFNCGRPPISFTLCIHVCGPISLSC